MASSTDNLGLLKPDPAENWSVQNHFNENMNKIDEFAGDARNKNAGSFSTINALTEILDTALASMPSSGVKAFQVNATATVGYFGAATYLCTLYKSGTNTTYASATFRRVDSPIVIDGARNSNGWNFNSLSNQIVRFWEGTVTTDSNGRFNANSTINVAGANKPVILGITCYEAWYHFRLYHGSNYNTMVQVTDYDVNTPKPNVTLTVRIAYAY